MSDTHAPDRSSDCRFAVYFAPPPTHPLWQAGSAWLGRDAADVHDTRGPRCAEVAPAWRYGFHATLKPPFRLAPGATVADLIEALQQLAKRHAAFDMPALQVSELAGFVALRPVAPVPAAHPLRLLADDAVRALDFLRATPEAAELQRRRHLEHSERQWAHLQRWGYPHVLDDWRFHMTLTQAFDPGDARCAAFRQQAVVHFAAALSSPLRCTDLALFVEHAANQPLLLLRRLPLSAA